MQAQYANVERLIALYSAIEVASREMLAAAIESNWDAVAQAQDRCAALIEQTRDIKPGVVMTEKQQRARLRIMKQILQNEAQVRRLSSPWSGRLDRPAMAA